MQPRLSPSSLCSQGWPRTPDSPASTSMLWLQVCATRPTFAVLGIKLWASCILNKSPTYRATSLGSVFLLHSFPLVFFFLSLENFLFQHCRVWRRQGLTLNSFIIHSPLNFFVIACLSEPGAPPLATLAASKPQDHPVFTSAMLIVHVCHHAHIHLLTYSCICLYVYVYMHMCASLLENTPSVHVSGSICRSEANLEELVLSLHHLGPRW